MKRLYFKSGEVVIREGEYSTDAYFIESGEVSILKGKEEVATLKQNATFGEIGCLEHKPRTATVVALTPLTLRVLKEEDAIKLR
ncbi:uncharacterized protein METZ01_LOCUS335544 [marine metagenome]|uniref:Cyclic nucleotide-binding domain-containing protein n=1 Tax=marine metagenome TaxID=408172 RepID=A0A382QCH4_9ZZZZ